MLVFNDARLVFLAMPKTASTAYDAALAPLASIRIDAPPELKHAPVFRYNRFFRPMLEKFVAQDIDILAVMREPVSWLGSWYRYRQRPALAGLPNSTAGVSFDEFVEAYCRADPPEFARVGSQAKFLEPQRNGTRVTHLFRYEDRAGLDAFLEERLARPVRTERLNISPEAMITLSAGTEARLRRDFATDFALWEEIGMGGQYIWPGLDKSAEDEE